MPIGEAIVHVECDKCGEVTDAMDLTPLAGGGWDARNIPKRLKREGWHIEADGKTMCPECVETTNDATGD